MVPSPEKPRPDPALDPVLPAPSAEGDPFAQVMSENGLEPLRSTSIEVLQVNLGPLCNQTCRHCHVDAGPHRHEQMTRETMLQCLEVLERGHIPIIDLTGGAPEMNPHFRWLVAQARQGGCQVIDRCNLTILLTPGCDSLPEFLAGQGVEVVASLPCYTAGNTDAQRGEGVFAKSLLALKKLNRVGYGISGSGLRLALVFNPQGPSLPPSQVALEADYRREMKTRFGVVFNRLFTLTNMPIGRFQQDLARTGRYVEYLRLLKGSFNPAAAAGVMCRTTLSVGWEGRLFDCDFNQMLGFGLEAGLPQHIGDFDRGLLASRPIVTGPHCFGCTAGNGSGCQGAIV